MCPYVHACHKHIFLCWQRGHDLLAWPCRNFHVQSDKSIHSQASTSRFANMCRASQEHMPFQFKPLSRNSSPSHLEVSKFKVIWRGTWACQALFVCPSTGMQFFHDPVNTLNDRIKYINMIELSPIVTLSLSRHTIFTLLSSAKLSSTGKPEASWMIGLVSIQIHPASTAWLHDQIIQRLLMTFVYHVVGGLPMADLLTYWNPSASVTLGGWGCDNRKISSLFGARVISNTGGISRESKTKTSKSSSKPTILHQQSPQTSPNSYWKWCRCFHPVGLRHT